MVSAVCLNILIQLVVKRSAHSYSLSLNSCCVSLYGTIHSECTRFIRECENCLHVPAVKYLMQCIARLYEGVCSILLLFCDTSLHASVQQRVTLTFAKT